MATTIRTSSKNYFTKIQKYLTNKKIFFTPSLNDGIYALTIFDLTTIETNSLILNKCFFRIKTIFAVSINN